MTEWELCPECRGEGKVVHPALSVWTEEDRYEDPEGFEDMMAGMYDQRCKRCDGRRVVEADNEEEQEDWEERLADARTRAMESGDAEAFYNPRINLY